jgi:Tfp pilus assembly protein PilN
MIRINLAPPRTKEKAGAARPSSGGINLGLVFGGLAALLVVGLGGYSWKLSSDIAWFNAEIDKNQQELERLKPIIAQHQRFKEEKEELERRVNAIESVARNQARPVYLLDSLADSLPGDLWLNRMEEKGQMLRLAGATYSSQTLADFMARLKSSGRFKEVDLVESRQDLTKSPRTITFEVACRFEI